MFPSIINLSMKLGSYHTKKLSNGLNLMILTRPMQPIVVSPRRCPCPLVVSRVHTAWPVSACRCPCPRVVARVCMSLPVSALRCPCLRVVARVRTCCLWSARRSPRPFMFVGGRFHLWAVRLRLWAVVFIQGCPSSFMGNSRVWWWGAIGWWW